MQTYKLGIDIGSTTIKMVLVNGYGEIVFNDYRRHQTRVNEILIEQLKAIQTEFGNITLSIAMTGSVGMGIAEQFQLPFVQEVVAATNFIKTRHPAASAMIDIGGEDAKIIFLHNGEVTDLRMNGNCAGGTGAFIDQMAILLNVTPEELGNLASSSTRIYPIASRCGVFSKTDIQNLISRNIPSEDIAASIFHAVAVQTISTLAHGHDINAPIVVCGGPFSFIPALREAFSNYLNIPADSIILPENANLIPAWGCAIPDNEILFSINQITHIIETSNGNHTMTGRLDPLFQNKEEYDNWKLNMATDSIRRAKLTAGTIPVFIGIDSGSTTTKIAVINENRELLYSFYQENNGNPIKSVETGLAELQELCRKSNTRLKVINSCSTGYGEDIIKAAFQMNCGIVETMAHYTAAKHLNENVSFILDIGGQDMKAIFIENNTIRRIEINEACSSGCGSFISTFAQSLNTTVDKFAEYACVAENPCDLGTRCTVFMNSKVKQVLREGASIADIAAGLSYSVVKNCLYKVLRLKSADELGDCIVVQGGTLRNNSIVRALELLTGHTVCRSECPELMGALGCALYASQLVSEKPLTIQEMLAHANYDTNERQCHGCENNCAITRYKFQNNNIYYSGNRCERVFSNRGDHHEPGINAYEKKTDLLFNRKAHIPLPITTIGIPRTLNMYEEYPFWHTLFTECGIQVVLSQPSNHTQYEHCVNKVMSDNICFPAKLAHSHIEYLAQQRIDRIFMPYVIFEQKEKQMQNSYNCPIVTAYSQVIQSNHRLPIPVDSPAITFKERKSLLTQCKEYLASLGIDNTTARKAFDRATRAQEIYEREIAEYNESIFKEAQERKRLTILLAGRPYHSDPLIQHNASNMVASLGAYVITDDIVRHKAIRIENTHYVSQWAYTNRIMKAAQWCAEQDNNVQYMQLTSFGCGPDAFMLDEIQTVLNHHHKNLTILKIDDVSNIGSLKLRARSLIESLKINHSNNTGTPATATTPIFTKNERHRKIIIPFFTPFLSPLIPAMLKTVDYDAIALPMSDDKSCDWGLKFSNNEVCYPATLIVGDIIKAFQSGRYNPDECAVGFVQTGGQCRASNYTPLLKKALIDNGYTNTPVVIVSFGSGIDNEQPGFSINWTKMLPTAMKGILYSDCIAKLYYATISRTDNRAEVEKLRNHFLHIGAESIERKRIEELDKYLALATSKFTAQLKFIDLPKVGIVGEIFLKYHPFAQKHITEWLVDNNIEVVYPMLTDFFTQTFVNHSTNRKTHITHSLIPDYLIRKLYNVIQRQFDKAFEICGKHPYFTPFEDIFHKAELAEKCITLNAQFGEGWLIPGEIAAMAEQGVTHVVSLQPFGCIANHIVQKGIENRLKAQFSQLNILSLDFDSSVSEVNITNRLLLFVDNLKNKGRL